MGNSIRNLKTVFISLSSLFLLVTSAKAQLIPDNTLGAETSQVTPFNRQIDDIIGGARRGSNLFHSFREFNVDLNRGVYFANPAGVNNILTRVTGGNPSNILGVLGVDGNANLFLINPNGIFFGNRSFLDIRGSFIGTTADEIRLGNTGSFSAVNPGSSNLLSIQPGALFTNIIRNIPSKIIVDGADLEVDRGQNITLSADAIDIIGFITAPGGSIDLEAINGGINLGIFNTGNFGFLDTSSITGNGGNISLNAQGGDININGIIDVSSQDFAGNTVANGGNVNIVTDRNIFLDIDSPINSFGVFGGNITLSSLGNITLFSNAQIQSISNGNISIPGAKGGTISITTNSLSLLDGSFIYADTNGAIDGGTIDIQARSLVEINGSSITADTFDRGKGGSININTPSLLVKDGGLITADTFDRGNGGSIDINTGFLKILNNGLIAADTGLITSNYFWPYW